MRFAIYANHMTHQSQYANAFRDGLVRHGITDICMCDTRSSLEDCDVAVFWSQWHQRIIDHQKAKGRDFIAMERGFVKDRMVWSSVGWNGINGRADFNNENSPPIRWIEHFKDCKQPWGSGKYGLILGQLPNDSQTRHVNLYDFYSACANKIRNLDVEPRFRPHPRNPADHPGVKTAEGTLAEALRGALFAVTFNSNSAVDAVLAGVPTVTYDPGATAWPVTNHDLDEIPQPQSRDQWCYDLAYAQWTVEEIANGDAWEQLCRH